MIPLFRVAVDQGAGPLVAEALRTGVLGHGPRGEEFEQALRGRLGVPYLTTLNNGTSALHLALRLAAGHGGGGEVLTTPYTFEATNWAILANGMRIRWVDVDPGTLTMDMDDLARKITPRTRAVMVVHWAGHPVDLDRLASVLDDAEAAHGFRPAVIEDCAQAWGSIYQGVPVGAHGNLCAFSFHATKHLACGTGGMLVTPDDETLRRALRLRFFGIDRAADRVNGDYDVPEWGYNFYLGELGAAVGLANLASVDARVDIHRRNADHYDAALAGVAGVELTTREKGRDSSFWLYPVKVDDRAAFIRRLAAAGITASAVVRRNDTHTAVRDVYDPDLPGLESVHDRVVHIPVGWWVSEWDCEHIAETIRSGW